MKEENCLELLAKLPLRKRTGIVAFHTTKKDDCVEGNNTMYTQEKKKELALLYLLTCLLLLPFAAFLKVERLSDRPQYSGSVTRGRVSSAIAVRMVAKRSFVWTEEKEATEWKKKKKKKKKCSSLYKRKEE